MLAQEIYRSQRFQRCTSPQQAITTSGSALVIARPFPDSDASRAPLTAYIVNH
jgi:hypothetical protein